MGNCAILLAHLPRTKVLIRWFQRRILVDYRLFQNSSELAGYILFQNSSDLAHGKDKRMVHGKDRKECQRKESFFFFSTVIK
jgi:hypothetical protein